MFSDLKFCVVLSEHSYHAVAFTVGATEKPQLVLCS